MSDTCFFGWFHVWAREVPSTTERGVGGTCSLSRGIYPDIQRITGRSIRFTVV